MNPVVVAAVDLDHEDRDRNVAATAARLAMAATAALHLVYIIPEPQETYIRAYVPKEMVSEVEHAAQRHLEELAGEIASDGQTVDTHVLHGSIYVTLLAQARDLGATVLVIGAHRPQLADFLLGPNSARVARPAPCSVYIVR